MKILKEGTLPKLTELYYRGTCENCGCEVEADYFDIKYLGDNKQYVLCPTKMCTKYIMMKCVGIK